MASTYENFEEAGNEGAKVLIDILRSGETSPEALSRGRMASAAMSSYAKLYQANSAREQTVVSIITHASPDAAEFRRLVGAALPGSSVAKALGEGPPPTVTKVKATRVKSR